MYNLMRIMQVVTATRNTEIEPTEISNGNTFEVFSKLDRNCIFFVGLVNIMSHIMTPKKFGIINMLTSGILSGC